jgi:Sec-independent protein translocase protein TatA
MADTLVVLIIVLVIVLIWRGPKTLPGIGAMFGRGVKNAREEAAKIRTGEGQTPPDDRPAA